MIGKTIIIQAISGCIHYEGQEHVAGGPPFACEEKEAVRLIKQGIAVKSSAEAPIPMEHPDYTQLLELIAAAQSPAELAELMPSEAPPEEIQAAFQARLEELEK